MFEVKPVGNYSKEIYANNKNFEVINLRIEALGTTIEKSMTVSEAKELSRQLNEVIEGFEPKDEQ